MEEQGKGCVGERNNMIEKRYFTSCDKLIYTHCIEVRQEIRAWLLYNYSQYFNSQLCKLGKDWDARCGEMYLSSEKFLN